MSANARRPKQLQAALDLLAADYATRGIELVASRERLAHPGASALRRCRVASVAGAAVALFARAAGDAGADRVPPADHPQRDRGDPRRVDQLDDHAHAAGAQLDPRRRPSRSAGSSGAARHDARISRLLRTEEPRSVADACRAADVETIGVQLELPGGEACRMRATDVEPARRSRRRRARQTLPTISARTMRSCRRMRTRTPTMSTRMSRTTPTRSDAGGFEQKLSRATIGDPPRRSLQRVAGHADPIDCLAMSERLHKLLAQHGLGSRREIEKWMLAGRVLLNGQPAQPGDRYQRRRSRHRRRQGRHRAVASDQRRRRCSSITSRKASRSTRRRWRLTQADARRRNP